MSESTIASDLMSNFHVIDLETQYKSMNKSQKKALTDQADNKQINYGDAICLTGKLSDIHGSM